MAVAGRISDQAANQMSPRARFWNSRSPFDPAARLRALRDRIRFRRKDPSRPALRVRPARVSDLPFIEALSGKVFNKYGPYRDWIRKWYQSDMAITIIALLAEKPVGFAMLGRFSGASRAILGAELLAIAVVPGKQRMGVGRMLMKEIEEIALSLGVNKLFLHTAKENLTAQRLFKSCLFTPGRVKKNFYPAGQDAIEMVKALL